MTRLQMDLQARRACAAVATVGLSYTLVGAQPLAASAASDGSSELPAHLGSARAVTYGSRAVVRGQLGAGRARVPLALEYAPSVGSSWTIVSRGVADRAGDYQLDARLTHSGLLRVLDTRASATVVSVAPAQASAALPVQVRAGLSVEQRELDVLPGQRTTVTGTVRPAVAGDQVTLQLHRGRRWFTVAHSRTGARGRYRLSYTPRQTGSDAARVSFQGNRTIASAQRAVGRLTAYAAVQASWYSAGGTTACGQQLTAGMLGVANKTLPCGTLVTLRNGGRSVRVPVIDRGPYVAGRDFDLTEATKAAIGFGGTGTIWATPS
jgi:peptidoglycan lytic transglycosylase